jgi:DNA-binding beta-propeller fold protein YncE
VSIRICSLLVLLAATFGPETQDAAAESAGGGAPRPIEELVPRATIRVGKTADWVAITEDAVWVGSTGPNAVSRIDPRTNTLVATVPVPGEPCAGLAVGHGSLWVPLCAHPNSLARVDLATREVTVVPRVGPARREGGITSSPDAIWLIVDRRATLVRIDPRTGEVRQRIHVPRGSYNPVYGAGRIWVSRADGAEVTVIDAQSGAVTGHLPSGPKPRFMTFGAGAVWTLNQGDGSLTRIDAQTQRVVQTTALRTPGPGGDIAFGRDMVWTTVVKTPLSIVDGHTGLIRCQWTGPGGDSLGIGHDAVWLTNYEAGTISRIEIETALHLCGSTQ